MSSYTKKIEPLTKSECILAGLTLFLWVLCLHALPFSGDVLKCREEVFKADIKSLEDLEKVHKCVNKTHRTGFLFGATCLLLGYPIIIAHIYYFKRVMDTLCSFLNLGVTEWIYICSWMIIATIYCTICPALVIFVSYYDWEFNSNYLYIGYTIEYQFGNLFLILWDCLILPMGLTAAMPWFISICIISGYFKSTFYDLNDEFRAELVKKMFGNFNCCKGNCGKSILVLINSILFLICIFGSFADVFDYNKEGFYSLHGGSQYLFIILYISWILLGGLTVHFAFSLEKHQNSLNQSIKPLREQASTIINN